MFGPHRGLCLDPMAPENTLFRRNLIHRRVVGRGSPVVPSRHRTPPHGIGTTHRAGNQLDCPLSHCTRKCGLKVEGCEAVGNEIERVSSTRCSRADDSVPFLVACKTKYPKLVEAALDGINKMVVNGHVSGETSPNIGGDKDLTLLDAILQTLYECANILVDPHAQIQMITTITTLVTNPRCHVHDKGLRIAVLTCMIIQLQSKSPVNRDAATAMLQQMCNAVFLRLQDAMDQVKPSGLSQVLTSSSKPARWPCWEIAQCRSCASPSLYSPREAVEAAATATATATAPSVPPTPTGELPLPPTVEDVADQAQQAPTSSQDGQAGAGTPAVPLPPPSASAPEAPTPSAGPTEDSAVPGASLDQNPDATAAAAAADLEDPIPDAGRTELPAAPGTPAVQHTAAAAAAAMATPMTDAATVPATPTAAPLSPAAVTAAAWLKDAIGMFSAICRISSKDAPSSPPDNPELRRKILSLQVLLAILDKSGHIIRHHERLVAAVQVHLVPAVLNNAGCPIHHVFRFSLFLFSQIVRHFRLLLKPELAVLLNVFLRILESPTSPLPERISVLEALRSVCQDGQALVDVYLNFDCDLHQENLFQRLVNAIARLGQGQLGDERTPAQQSLEAWALHDVACIMRALSEWADRDPEVTSALHSRQQARLLPQQAHPAGDEEDGVSVEESSVTVSVSVAPSASTGPGVPASPLVGLLPAAGGPGGDRLENIDRIKQVKSIIGRGIELFNQKPKRGIEFLAKQGFIEKTPVSIARFFHVTAGLSPTMIGEFFGDPAAFNLECLEAYIEAIDTHGMLFDNGIRKLLTSFRLPGEGQKIYRILEKFSDHYCKENPEVFKDSEAALILAYAITMLHTDAHTKLVTNHMSKETFTAENLKLGVTAEYLSGIYDRITSKEIILVNDDHPYAVSPAADRQAGRPPAGKKVKRNEKEEQENFDREKMLVERLKQDRQKMAGPMLQAIHVEHVRKMLEEVVWPIVATISVALENSQLPATVHVCLDVYRCAIHIAAMFEMSTEREALVKTLATFTGLQLLGSRSTGQAALLNKHIDALKALLAIAHTDGNGLQASWAQVLLVVSNIFRLATVAEGTHSPYQQLFDTSDTAMSEEQLRALAGEGTGEVEPGSETAADGAARSTGPRLAMPPPPERAKTEQRNAARIGQEAELRSNAEALFPYTAKLNAMAVVDFVKALCWVSAQEMVLDTAAPHRPRTVFSLQKLLETAEYNIDRPLPVWDQIWQHLESHYTRVACDRYNVNLATLALTTLRILATKSLDRPDLPEYPPLFLASATVTAADPATSGPAPGAAGEGVDDPTLTEALPDPDTASRPPAITATAATATAPSPRATVAPAQPQAQPEMGHQNHQLLQVHFLRPFEVIMGRQPIAEIRELVLQCVGQLMVSGPSKIRAGWAVLFGVFKAASRDPQPALVNYGFTLLKGTIREKLAYFLPYALHDCVGALDAYANCEANPALAVEAVLLLDFCLRALAGEVPIPAAVISAPSSPAPPPSPAPASAAVLPLPQPPTPLYTPLTMASLMSSLGSSTSDQEGQLVHLWFPIFVGLSQLACNASRAVVREHGPLTTPSLVVSCRMLWRGVLRPILDEARHHIITDNFIQNTATATARPQQPAVAPEETWLRTTYSAALRVIIAVVSLFFDPICAPRDEPAAAPRDEENRQRAHPQHPVFEELLDFLVDCCQQLVLFCHPYLLARRSSRLGMGRLDAAHEDLARMSVTALEQLLLATGPFLGPQHWARATQSLVSLFARTLPEALLDLVPQPTGAAPPTSASPSPAGSPVPASPSTERRAFASGSLTSALTPAAAAVSQPAAAEEAVGHPPASPSPPATPTSEVVPAAAAPQPAESSAGEASKTESPPAAPIAAAALTPAAAIAPAVATSDRQPEAPPSPSLSSEPPAQTPPNPTASFRATRSRCVIHLLLIQATSTVIERLWGFLATANITALLGCLRRSIAFARRFNADYPLRLALWRAGFLENIPSLNMQESIGTTNYLRVLTQMLLQQPVLRPESLPTLPPGSTLPGAPARIPPRPLVPLVITATDADERRGHAEELLFNEMQQVLANYLALRQAALQAALQAQPAPAPAAQQPAAPPAPTPQQAVLTAISLARQCDVGSAKNAVVFVLETLATPQRISDHLVRTSPRPPTASISRSPPTDRMWWIWVVLAGWVQFKGHLGSLYRMLVELIDDDLHEVRLPLVALFGKRIPTALAMAPLSSALPEEATINIEFREWKADIRDIRLKRVGADLCAYVDFYSVERAVDCMRKTEGVVMINRQCVDMSYSTDTSPLDEMPPGRARALTNTSAGGGFPGGEDWLCPRCNYLNFGSRPLCNRCGGERTSSGPRAVLHNDPYAAQFYAQLPPDTAVAPMVSSASFPPAPSGRSSSSSVAAPLSHAAAARFGGDSDFGRSEPAGGGGDAPPSSTLFAKNLDPSLTREQACPHWIMDFFSLYRPVRDVRIIRDRSTHLSRGLAFVEFVSLEDATAMLAMSGLVISGLPVRLCYARPEIGGAARPRREKPPTFSELAAQQQTAYGGSAPAGRPSERAPSGPAGSAPAAGDGDLSEFYAALGANAAPPGGVAKQEAIFGADPLEEARTRNLPRKEREQSHFVYDAATRKYYDRVLGFAYDPQTQLYTNMSTGACFTLDPDQGLYVPYVPAPQAQGAAQKAHPPAAQPASAASQARALEGPGAPSVVPKKDKRPAAPAVATSAAKVGDKMASQLERWNRQGKELKAEVAAAAAHRKHGRSGGAGARGGAAAAAEQPAPQAVAGPEPPGGATTIDLTQVEEPPMGAAPEGPVAAPPGGMGRGRGRGRGGPAGVPDTLFPGPGPAFAAAPRAASPTPFATESSIFQAPSVSGIDPRTGAQILAVPDEPAPADVFLPKKPRLDERMDEPEDERPGPLDGEAIPESFDWAAVDGGLLSRLCTLCQRIFPRPEDFQAHKSESRFHKRRVENALKEQKSQEQATSVSAESSHRYRNRAAERRQQTPLLIPDLQNIAAPETDSERERPRFRASVEAAQRWAAQYQDTSRPKTEEEERLMGVGTYNGRACFNI
ncbi:putative Brefeldin A-inhibited guanine nucleotide-exchange protein 2 [Paratrimastix pyriformis]|uniref:Brefeldin A-inhibited guanine nucleotide-exchange protein 2 n=1 Tax=Paratrimastix pyriformis TaxID=342808 RepID=A0ABQ8UZJ6_9EUKA|nr:putative Brefeldin A-inhibited guanine nucleotide-exchange protein 2 [Paratrimastix pyriformis]